MSQSLTRLIAGLKQLPGIGERSAQRIARYLLKLDEEQVEELAEILLSSHRNIRPCDRCGNLTENQLCSICADPSRVQTEICVVEDAFDIATIEAAGVYKGVYHVLGGALSPLEDISPEQLNIQKLIKRVDDEGIKEVILATSATSEGEATAHYVASQLQGKGIKVTRIARGIPVGTDLGLADQVTISKALHGRESVDPGDRG